MLTVRTVFTSPEIAISPLFKEAVLASSDIVARLRLVDLDVIVMTWVDSFRPAYRSLHVLRNRIQKNIPWFGTSATLLPDIARCVLNNGGFQKVPTLYMRA
jgi:superfamily II DNA helicase RecQ